MRVVLVFVAVLLLAQPVRAQDLTPGQARATRIVAEAQERGAIALATENAPTATPKPTIELSTLTPIAPTATSQPVQLPTAQPIVEIVTATPVRAQAEIPQPEQSPMWARGLAGVGSLLALAAVGYLIRRLGYRR